MVGSQGTPMASFAELWEQLGMAHKRELSQLREAHARMRSRLAPTGHEYPCCGTFEDKDGRRITVGAAADSLVVTFPDERAQLARGEINVLGLSGKYADGVIAWDNGESWRKEASSGDNNAAASSTTSAPPPPPPEGSPPESEGGGAAAAAAKEEEEEARRPRIQRLRFHEGDLDEDGQEAGARAGEGPAGGREPDGPDGGIIVEPLATGPAKETKRRNLPRIQRQSTGFTVPEAVRNFASPRHKEKLPFSKHKTVVQIRETFKCKACRVLERIVRSALFEAAVWFLIALSAAGMAAELQYVGHGLGFELGYDGYVASAEERFPGATDAFSTLEWVFGASFTTYVTLKILVFGREFWCGSERLWNLSDLIIVLLWWIWQTDNISRTGGGDFHVKIHPQLLRVFRLSRLIRHLKMVREFMTFDSLHVMTTALKGSLHVFVWAVLLLCLFQTILALVLTSTIQAFYLDVDANDIMKRRDVYEYFGTFTRTFLTMFELTLANWPVPSRILTENISEWWTVFAILHKLTIGFALVGIINGVFMQETFKVAAIDDRIMLRQKQAAGKVHETKMRALFTHLDTSHDGKLDMKEFQQIVRDRQVKDWLAAQDITVTDADGLFKLIAGHPDGQITSDELIAGLGRMKGTVRTLDFMLLMQQVSENNDILRSISSGKLGGPPQQ